MNIRLVNEKMSNLAQEQLQIVKSVVEDVNIINHDLVCLRISNTSMN